MIADPSRRRTHRIGARSGVALCPIAAALAGCIPLPVPLPSVEVGPVPEQIVTQIRPGTSTRADVLLLLGDPIVRGPEDAYFVYTWAYRRGGVMVFGLTGGGPIPLGDVEQYTCRALAVRFAATGQVDRAATFEGSARSAYGGPDVSTSISQLCRQDADLVARIRDWVAAPPATGDVSPPGAPPRP